MYLSLLYLCLSLFFSDRDSSSLHQRLLQLLILWLSFILFITLFATIFLYSMPDIMRYVSANG